MNRQSQNCSRIRIWALQEVLKQDATSHSASPNWDDRLSVPISATADFYLVLIVALSKQPRTLWIPNADGQVHAKSAFFTEEPSIAPT